MTSHHKLGGLKQWEFILYSSGGHCQISRCRQGGFLLEALRANFQASLLASGGHSNPGHPLVCPHIPPASASAFTLPFPLCLLISSCPYKDTVLGFRACPKSRMIPSQDPSLNYICKDSFQNKVTFTGSRGPGNLGVTIQPLHFKKE